MRIKYTCILGSLITFLLIIVTIVNNLDTIFYFGHAQISKWIISLQYPHWFDYKSDTSISDDDMDNRLRQYAMKIHSMSDTKDKNIFFSMTTFLGKNGKYEELMHALASLMPIQDDINLLKSKIDKFLIINEYDEKNEFDSIKRQISFIQNKYPFIIFINKNHTEKGQAFSLNIIINYFKTFESKTNCKYWIHWEDSFFLRRPLKILLNEIVNVMDYDVNIDQLGFAPVTYRFDLHEIFQRERHNISIKQKTIYYSTIRLKGEINQTFYNKYFINEYSEIDDAFISPFQLNSFPLYTLRPSIMRIDSIIKIGYFNTSPTKWPFLFEMHFGIKFMSDNLTAALTSNVMAYHHPFHKSTYDKGWLQWWLKKWGYSWGYFKKHILKKDL